MSFKPFTLGVDLGQQQDYTALCVTERIRKPTGRTRTVEERDPSAGPFVNIETGERGPAPKRVREVPIEKNHYHLRHIERFELGTSYPAQVERVEELMQVPPLRGKTSLVVDATGVGRPIVDMLNERNLMPHAVWITGGDQVTKDGREYRVPKRELASVVQAFLQSGRLKFAKGLPLGQVLREELKSFRVKVNIATGHDRYEHHREGDHDDLVLALAMALWYDTTYFVDYSRP